MYTKYTTKMYYVNVLHVLLKEVLPEVIDPLLAIINSSLSLGYVPKNFKLAVIKPLIKKPQLDPKDLVNYRPISNLKVRLL